MSDTQERFSLPSQFVLEDDVEQYRLKTDKIYSYKRGDTLLAVLDFSDFAVNKTDLDELGEDKILESIANDAVVMAHQVTKDEFGGLQIGDTEYLNDEKVKDLTEVDIFNINKFLKEIEMFHTDPNKVPDKGDLYSPTKIGGKVDV